MMKLETTGGNLASAMKLAAGVVERRNTFPILGCVRIGNGKVVATNLDQAVEVAVPQVGRGEGEGCVDYFRLSALVRHVDADEPVAVIEKDSLAEISFNGSVYSLASLPASDFPKFPDVTGERTETDNMGLAAALACVSFAISSEETRYYLNGVAFLEIDGSPAVCATDGYRLAIHPLPFMPGRAIGKILRRETVDYIAARKREPKALTVGETRVRAEYDGLTLCARLIDGTYPDVRRVIPKDAVPYFTVDRSRLLTVLRRMASFMAAESRYAVRFAGADGVLTLHHKGDGEGRETIPCEMNEPFEAGYNCRYLIEALSRLTGERVTFSSEKGQIAGAPAVIKGEGDPLLIIQMPMRV